MVAAEGAEGNRGGIGLECGGTTPLWIEQPEEATTKNTKVTKGEGGKAGIKQPGQPTTNRTNHTNGEGGSQGSNSRKRPLRKTRKSRKGKGGRRGGGAIQRRSGPEKTAGLLHCSSANRLFSLRNHLCTLCVLCGERSALLGPVVGGIDAGVVQRAVDRDPIRAIDSPVVPAGWADGESRCHLDPALLAFGDGPDFLGHFG